MLHRNDLLNLFTVPPSRLSPLCATPPTDPQTVKSEHVRDRSSRYSIAILVVQSSAQKESNNSHHPEVHTYIGRAYVLLLCSLRALKYQVRVACAWLWGGKQAHHACGK